MNKSIKALYTQAHVIEERWPAGCDGHPENFRVFSVDKFTELLVEACARRCLEMRYVNPQPHHYAAAIRELLTPDTVASAALVLRADCDRLVTALVGEQLSSAWWSSANKAFDNQTPETVFETQPQQVLSYLMKCTTGEG